VRWEFNDDVFEAIDWTVPITTPIDELYKLRAQQIRDKYDFVSLFYSGGVDSNNILHAFIDNDIKLDEVIMFKIRIWDANNKDTSTKNVFSEIDYAAIPHLNKYLKGSDTIVRVVYLDDLFSDFFASESISSQYHYMNTFSPNSLGKIAICALDKTWWKLFEAGKSVCHLHGTDKPMIRTNGGIATFRFYDVNTFTITPHEYGPESIMMATHQFHEFFYWTPDLPQLVVKQCQLVKHMCDINPHIRLMFGDPALSIEKLHLVNRCVYSDVVNSIEDLFATDKPPAGLFSPHNTWLGSIAPRTREQFDSIISYLKANIDDRFFMGAGNQFLDEAHSSISRQDTFVFSRSKPYNLGKLKPLFL
jgi:hypothetical protein